MRKYRGCIPLLIAALCLLLTGCGSDDAGNTVIDEEDTRTYIGVPKEPDDKTDTADTEAVSDIADTSEDTAGGIINDTPEDTAADTSEDTSEDTTETDEDTSSADSELTPPDDGFFVEMTDEPTVIDATGGNIYIGDMLSPMTPVEGTLISEQSDRLILMTKYSCRMKTNGAVEVQLEVGLQFYNLICGPKKDMGYITVDQETYKFSTGQINREGQGKYYLPFTEYTFECAPEKTSCELDIGWDFIGTYAGDVIDTLTNSCTLIWDSEAYVG